MKIYELSKDLGLENNKELISFLKEKGFSISSHNQNVTEEMIKLAKEHFVVVKEVEVKKAVTVKETVKKEIPTVEVPVQKTYSPDDLIPCRSVTPWRVVDVGVDGTLYNWSGFGDIDYVSYKNLQTFRRKELLTRPYIVIDDSDLLYQWRRDLGEAYKYYLGVEYPEEFFDLPDTKFEEILNNAPDSVKDVLKTTALNMIKNTNYPSVQKLTLLDNIIGTCLKDFL